VRNNILIPLLLAVSLLAGGYYLHRGQSTTRQKIDEHPMVAPDGSPGPGESSSELIDEVVVPALKSAVTNADKMEAQSPEETYKDERIAYLADLGMQSDMPSLIVILSELSSRDPEIRSAAREAAIQFGSRGALPELQKAISQTDDPHEKADMAEAIEFLSLTNVTELGGND
jgi:hypothetical protein